MCADSTDTPAVVPYLIVADARRAIDWYTDALGARMRGAPMVMPDQRIGHSELDFGGGVVYVADESPASHVAAPRRGEPSAVSLTVQVLDVDAAVERAVAAGAELQRLAADNPYGRNAVIVDPFGHRWMLSATAPAPAAARAVPRGRDGDIAYMTMEVRDADRTRAFYRAVLGWRFAPGRTPGGWNVEGAVPMTGVSGGHDAATAIPMYHVADVEAAVERVRAAGGTAAAPESQPYGITADCTDDQGTRFVLGQLG